MAKPRDIGVDVAPPKKEGRPGDPLDPFYGTLSVRGQIITGQVTSTKMQGSCIVTREYSRYVPKYERFEKRTSKYTAHVPSCIEVHEGDVVKIMECRPISKTKAFVVVESKAGSLRIIGEDATAPAEKAGEVNE